MQTTQTAQAQLPLQTWTRQQLLQFAESVIALADWAIVRDFANQVYGEDRAAKVEIETHEEYDDENYSYPIGDITGYDQAGNELKFDRRLPFFKTKAWKDHMKTPYGDEFSNFKYFTMTLKEKHGKNWVLFDDLPVKDKTYDLTTPPQVSLEPVK
jgi:hypothetical protein